MFTESYYHDMNQRTLVIMTGGLQLGLSNTPLLRFVDLTFSERSPKTCTFGIFRFVNLGGSILIKG